MTKNHAPENRSPENRSPEIIAEIAQGYEGKPLLAELLVKGALNAGADIVKIQLVFADELCVPTYPYFDLFKSLEMPNSVWASLVESVHKAGRRIYFDIYGERSLALARELGVDGVKISTTDFYNRPLVMTALELMPRVLISTGGVPAEDIDELMALVKDRSKVTLMHGFQAEPTLLEDNNLARIRTLKEKYEGVQVGFMDHSLGSADEALQLPLIALGLGVDAIEKHISLDYSLQIEDYVSALSVDRFLTFVSTVRTMSAALGRADLGLTAKEIEYKKRAGKVVVAKRPMNKGEQVTVNDIAMKRVSTTPSDKYFPRVESLLGKTLSVGLMENSPIEIGTLL